MGLIELPITRKEGKSPMTKSKHARKSRAAKSMELSVKSDGNMELSVTVYPEDYEAAYAELGLQQGCLQGRGEDHPLFEQIHNKVMQIAIERALTDQIGQAR